MVEKRDDHRFKHLLQQMQAAVNDLAWQSAKMPLPHEFDLLVAVVLSGALRPVVSA